MKNLAILFSIFCLTSCSNFMFNSNFRPSCELGNLIREKIKNNNIKTSSIEYVKGSGLWVNNKYMEVGRLTDFINNLIKAEDDFSENHLLGVEKIQDNDKNNQILYKSYGIGFEGREYAFIEGFAILKKYTSFEYTLYFSLTDIEQNPISLYDYELNDINYNFEEDRTIYQYSDMIYY